MTELVDSITKSEDKDKLLPSLKAVWNNTLPYLKSKRFLFIAFPIGNDSSSSE